MKVHIRPFRPSDLARVTSLVNVSAMSTVNRCFWVLSTRDFVSHLVLMLSAVMFILLNLSLQHCLCAIPFTFGSLYAAVWLGHKAKVHFKHRDLKDIPSNYQSSPKTGFWVAELEGDTNGRDSGLVIGAVGLRIKEDPDRKDPPGSVSWLTRMAVDPKYQNRGVGRQLLDFVVDHCREGSRFKAIELLTTEFHDR